MRPTALLQICGFALALSACGGGGTLPPGAPLATVATEYRLGPGDVVRVNVFDDERLSGEYTVSASGAVDIPLIGSVPATGGSDQALAERIEAMLRERQIISQPNVSTQIITYRPFYILGEVDRPGQYPFQSGMTLSKAIATAGGYTARAEMRRAYITRDGAGEETIVELSASTPIGPGDTIRIGERHF